MFTRSIRQCTIHKWFMLRINELHRIVLNVVLFTYTKHISTFIHTHTHIWMNACMHAYIHTSAKKWKNKYNFFMQKILFRN